MQKPTSKKQEVKKLKESSPKKGAGASTTQSQAAPAAKPKRYSSQRQRQTQQMPLPVPQGMVPQMGAMYPDQAYYEQMGELAQSYYQVCG